MANVPVPLIVTKHAYVVTEKIEGISRMPNVRDHDSSIYLKVQGDSLSVGGYEVDPIFVDDVSLLYEYYQSRSTITFHTFLLIFQIPKDAVFSLYELDWDVFGVHIDGAINRCPVLESTGIKSTVCGPESFTPDHKPLMGNEKCIEI